MTVTLGHRDELRDRMAALIADVGPLHTVSGLGFSDERESRVRECLAAVSADRRWRFLDLRAAPGTAAIEPLRAAQTDPILVVATRADDVPRPLQTLVRAVIDKQAQVDLGDFEPLARSERQSLVVLFQGCQDLEGIDRELRRIPYWDFIR